MKKALYFTGKSVRFLFVVICLLFFSSFCSAYSFEVGFTSKFTTDQYTCYGGDYVPNTGTAELFVKSGYSCSEGGDLFKELSCKNVGDLLLVTIPPGGDAVVNCNLDSSPFEVGPNCVKLRWCGQESYKDYDTTRLENVVPCTEGECNCAAAKLEEMTCCTGGKMTEASSKTFCGKCAENELCGGLEVKGVDVPEGCGVKQCGLVNKADCRPDQKCVSCNLIGSCCEYSESCCSGVLGQLNCGAWGTNCGSDQRCVPDGTNTKCVCQVDPSSQVKLEIQLSSEKDKINKASSKDGKVWLHITKAEYMEGSTRNMCFQCEIDWGGALTTVFPGLWVMPPPPAVEAPKAPDLGLAMTPYDINKCNDGCGKEVCVSILNRPVTGCDDILIKTSICSDSKTNKAGCTVYLKDITRIKPDLVECPCIEKPVEETPPAGIPEEYDVVADFDYSEFSALPEGSHTVKLTCECGSKTATGEDTISVDIAPKPVQPPEEKPPEEPVTDGVILDCKGTCPSPGKYCKSMIGKGVDMGCVTQLIIHKELPLNEQPNTICGVEGADCIVTIQTLDKTKTQDCSCIPTLTKPPVEETPESVSIEAPLEGSKFAKGESVEFKAKISAKAPYKVEWSSDKDGALGDKEIYIINTGLNLGEHKISIKVTDADGKVLQSPNPVTITIVDDIPKEFDWSHKVLPNADPQGGDDWMSPVKDQGSCGSCWAFAALGAIEAQYNIETNNPNADIDLSEQDLISCSGAGDCCGGHADDALEKIKSVGVADESCFPYNDGDCDCYDDSSDTYSNCQCKEKAPYCSNFACNAKCTSKWKISGFSPVSKDSDKTTATAMQIKKALIKHGPLVATLKQEWHVIVIVGYDSQGKWIVKDSAGGYYSSFEATNLPEEIDDIYYIDGVVPPESSLDSTGDPGVSGKDPKTEVPCTEGECNCAAAKLEEMTCCTGGKMTEASSKTFCGKCAENELCGGLRIKSAGDDCGKCGTGLLGLDNCDAEECHGLGKCVFFPDKEGDSQKCVSCNELKKCADYPLDECVNNRCGVGDCLLSGGKCGENPVGLSLESLDGVVRARLSNPGLVNLERNYLERIGICDQCEISWGDGQGFEAIEVFKAYATHAFESEGDYQVSYRCNCGGVVSIAESSIHAEAFSTPSECSKVQYNGQPDDKLDIAFIGFGYSSKDDLLAQINKQISYLFNVPPYSNNVQKINVWGLMGSASLDCKSELDRSLFCNYPEVYKTASKCPYDKIVVLISQKDTGIGGGADGGTTTGVTIIPDELPSTPEYTDISDKYFIVHEFSHALGLGDEYVLDPSTDSEWIDFVSKRPIAPNCDTAGCPKWAGKISGAGCFPGCGLDSRYRSSSDCIMDECMWDDSCPFCPVCSKYLSDYFNNYK